MVTCLCLYMISWNFMIGYIIVHWNYFSRTNYCVQFYQYANTNTNNSLVHSHRSRSGATDDALLVQSNGRDWQNFLLCRVYRQSHYRNVIRYINRVATTINWGRFEVNIKTNLTRWANKNLSVSMLTVGIVASCNFIVLSRLLWSLSPAIFTDVWGGYSEGKEY